MRASGLLAGVAFLGLVPGAIAAAYAGYWGGLYPYAAIPLAFGVVLVVALAGLFALLPAVRRHVD